jgi:hypothetical protein
MTAKKIWEFRDSKDGVSDTVSSMSMDDCSDLAFEESGKLVTKKSDAGAEKSTTKKGDAGAAEHHKQEGDTNGIMAKQEELKTVSCDSISDEYLLSHRGQLVTFSDYQDMYARPRTPMDEDEADEVEIHLSTPEHVPLTARRGEYRKYTVKQVEELIDLVTTKGIYSIFIFKHKIHLF